MGDLYRFSFPLDNSHIVYIQPMSSHIPHFDHMLQWPARARRGLVQPHCNTATVADTCSMSSQYK